MIEPVTSRQSGNAWELYPAQDPDSLKKIQAADVDKSDAAMEEVVSYYYLSSIQSLQPSHPLDTTDQGQVQGLGKTEKTTLQRFTTWLWGLFGVAESSKGSVAATQEGGDPIEGVNQSAPLTIPSFPKLQCPETLDRDRLSKAIAEINKDLLYRLRDTAEFEAEMLKSNSNGMDRLILFHIMSKSLEQKKLKEEFSLEAHEEVLDLQKQNKDLHLQHYKLIEDIVRTAKTNKVLHWVNIGTTVGIAGTLAVAFVTGGTGAIFAIALPALSILKGSATAAEGVLKYKNDLRTGELTEVNHHVKSNRNKINDKVSITLAYADEEISNLLKTIRHHLENYSKEARLNLKGN